LLQRRGKRRVVVIPSPGRVAQAGAAASKHIGRTAAA
jgi:hypothetical protein